MFDTMRISPYKLVLALWLGGYILPVRTYVAPFGIRHCPPPSSSFVAKGRPAATLQLQQTFPRRMALWARVVGKKDDEEEEDWEPTEADFLEDIEDLNLDDVDDDVDIVDDTMVMINDDDDEDVVITDDDEIDDDEDDDEDLDIWEEEEEEEDEDEIVEELDEDVEYEEDVQPTSYLGGEVEFEDEEWDEDEGNSDVPLMDDPDDPNYMAQKKLVEETVARREEVRKDKEFDEFDFLLNRMPAEMADALEQTDFVKETSELEDMVMQLTVEDVEKMDLDEALAQTSDLMADDPYDNQGRDNIMNSGISDDDMEQVDKAYKRIQKALAQEPWNKVEYKAEITDFESLPNQTLQEMDACLDEISGSAYNCTRWLLYDLDFNVSNLILAAVKHNPQAPIIFQHWFPQLVTYERYQHARDINFDFSWDDVEQADVSELERYYMGFGYTEIPTKAPSETGIIGFDDLDEEELKMAAFENWMIEVYNPEWDRKDFDDDTFQDEDNVYSKFFEEPQHPDLPTYEDVQDDFQNWEEELEEEGEENQEYKDFVAKQFKYNFDEDEEFKKEFRGHLIVACTPSDEDVEIAEKITQRMNEEYGKQVYVETRVMAHAREEDNVFEVWLESYEVDLLHSKKRATSGAEGWTGPAECDDDQVEYLVKEVGFLISDDARYGYRMQLDMDLAK